MNPQHSSLFQIAGVTIEYQSDIPFLNESFTPALLPFRTNTTGIDLVRMKHHYTGIDEVRPFGSEIYRKPPWVIYKRDDGWVYACTTIPEFGQSPYYEIGFFSSDYCRGEIYHTAEVGNRNIKIQSLSLTTTDQIILSQVFARRQSCYLHSSGVIYNHHGYLFVGHSGAGKSTTLKLLDQDFEILCDDRMILRHWPDGFYIHGSWSHGEIDTVSPKGAPLKAIFFLEQSAHNRIIPMADRAEPARLLPFYVIKPLVSREWWVQILELIKMLIAEVPCYRMQFDKSGQINHLLKMV